MELERGDARLRKVAILVILLTVAVGAGALLALQYWLETLRLRPAPQARQSLAAALLWSTATICVTLLAAAAYAWRLGARARGASRFPPPGMRVLRDTVVLHGPAAGRRARLLQALAVALGACGVGLFVAAVLLLAAVAWAADAPPATFIDRGACPFECCVYRTWQTRADTVAYARPERGAPVVGRLKAGAPVEAVTGEVHSRPVRFVVKKPHGEFRVGEFLWVYTYLGEGHFRVWRDGAMREVDLGFSPYGGSPGIRCQNSRECWGELEKPLEFSWWVKLRSPDEWEGWSNLPEHFGNKDGCGG